MNERLDLFMKIAESLLSEIYLESVTRIVLRDLLEELQDRILPNSSLMYGFYWMTAKIVPLLMLVIFGRLLWSVWGLASKIGKVRVAVSFHQAQTVSVPKLGEFLLYLFLSKEQRESLPGDLEEEFITVIVPKFGLRQAKLWYWSQVLRSIGPLLTRQVVKLVSLSWVVNYVRRWMQS